MQLQLMLITTELPALELSLRFGRSVAERRLSVDAMSERELLEELAEGHMDLFADMLLELAGGCMTVAGTDDDEGE